MSQASLDAVTVRGPVAEQPGAAAVVKPHAFVLPGSRGGLCALYFAPQRDVPAKGDVLVVPPFAEEMNRCRAMVSLQARTWAEAGVGTLVLDPYGTGDSAGDFVDATWSQWHDDLRRGIAWLERHGQGCQALLGIRLGAIMAAELAREATCVRHLLLWQPVLSGKTFYTQFLRIRIAAELNLPERVKSTNELRQMGASGQAVEVSGYEVGPALGAELDGLSFDAKACAPRTAISWFEVNAEAEATLAPASQQAIDGLRDAGMTVHSCTVVGPAFWHVHERELAPALIAATAQCSAAWGVHGATGSAEPAEPVPTAVATPAEFPLVLPCGPELLSANLHVSAPDATRGVVIVVAGGPQYRAGAHRQFVAMARKLVEHGHPVLRFDLRGMGDSSGSYLGYEHSVPDIRAAIDELMARQPQLRDVALIGECESASGILFYAFRDPRVGGAVLINPWVRTDEGRAQVILKDYYLDRLRSPEFWAKLRSGRFDPLGSLRSLADVVRAYVRGKRMFARSSLGQANDDLSALPLPVRTATGMSRFKGRVLLLMSGNDYIAREFDEVVAASRAWDGLLTDTRVLRREIAGADHTFSRKHWKEAASDTIVGWIKSW